MSTQAYEHVIAEGIKGLPPETLAEIADFVLFARRRALQPQVWREELEAALDEVELKQLGRDQVAHLESEFAGYAERFPIE